MTDFTTTTTVRDCSREGHWFGYWTTGNGCSCGYCGLRLDALHVGQVVVLQPVTIVLRPFTQIGIGR